MSPTAKLTAAFLTMFCLLFSQMALASYVCPMEQGGGMAAMVMQDCQGMDKVQVSLCQAHAQDQASKQSNDKPDLPTVQPFFPALMIAALVPADLARALHDETLEASLLHRANAPPIAIRHCCFRL